jgi:hypothetical protein
MVELLLMAALLAALLSGIGALVRRNALEQARSHQGQGLSRVRQQLQQEIALAQRLSGSSADLPRGCSVSNPLVLFGPGWRIAYGLRLQGPNRDWQGPAQLLRCGPPYSTAGLNRAAAPIQSVLIDRLAAGEGFRASAADAAGPGGVVAISLQVHAEAGHLPPSRFQGRLAGTAAAAGAASPAERFGGCSGLCEETDSTNHWRPTGGTIAGDTTKIDILYFPLDRQSYGLSSPCDGSVCTITGNPTVIVYNGDQLVFSDQQLPLN